MTTDRLGPRPLRERFRSNIKVHYDLEDLRTAMRLQYHRTLLMVTVVRAESFQALVLVENGKPPVASNIREFDRDQLRDMRRPPRWLTRQQDAIYGAHE